MSPNRSYKLSWMLIYLFLAELFPIDMRASLSGLCSLTTNFYIFLVIKTFKSCKEPNNLNIIQVNYKHFLFSANFTLNMGMLLSLCWNSCLCCSHGTYCASRDKGQNRTAQVKILPRKSIFSPASKKNEKNSLYFSLSEVEN